MGLEGVEVDKLGAKIGDDQRIAKAVAAACLTAVDHLLHCRAEHDVL